MKKIIAFILLFTMIFSMFASCTDDHEHKFDDKWSSDSDYHWHACTVDNDCDEKKGKEAHDFEVIINEDGKPINRCKVCEATNDKVTTAPEHEHVFAEEITSNENFHWYPCTVENCYEMSEKAEHTYGNPEITYSDKKITLKYTCVDCEYEKIEEQTVSTEVDNSVSWDEAFKNFELTNFTLDVYFKYVDGTHTNHVVVTETEAYYCIPDAREFYTVPNTDGTYTTYWRDDSDLPFTLLDDTSNEYLIGAQTTSVIQISFEENFEKFTYDEVTGSYICNEAISAIVYEFDGGISDTMYCYNSVVKITNGKISYVSANYYFDESELTEGEKSFKYYNIGMSVVEIPQSVIDNAVKESE